MDAKYTIMQVSKEMKYYTVNTSVKYIKYMFDVLTTILDAIVHVEIDMLQFLKSKTLQNMFQLAQHLKYEQLKLCFCASFYHGRHLGCHVSYLKLQML